MKSGGRDFLSASSFIPMTGNGGALVLTVLSLLRLVSSWRRACAGGMEVIAGFWPAVPFVRRTRDGLRVGTLPELISKTASRAEERLRQENVALREEIDKASMFEEIVGTSTPLKAVLSQIAKVAPTDSTVLITGETGTGKELIARAIHKTIASFLGSFHKRKLCCDSAKTLISSELFGHEKGAFTGAIQRRLAGSSWPKEEPSFLTKSGNSPPEAQIALLRVLQEREFERVGGDQTIRADVRVIAATNRDLQTAIASDTFRSDLFYRLNVVPLEMPPLRERRDDIPLLVDYFVDRYASNVGKRIRGVDRRTLDQLQSYTWPGNVRELQNVIERSVILCDTETLSVDESWLSRNALFIRSFAVRQLILLPIQSQIFS